MTKNKQERKHSKSNQNKTNIARCVQVDLRAPSIIHLCHYMELAESIYHIVDPWNEIYSVAAGDFFICFGFSSSFFFFFLIVSV